MKRALLLPTVIVALLWQPSARAGIDYAAESRQLIKIFAGELKGALVGAMTRDGPIAAIEVCAEQAPAIASRVALASGTRIARTSLKTRNPRNLPQDWERQVLEDFQQRASTGESVKSLEYSQKAPDEHTAFRFMKAIPMDGLCTTCHGAQISDEISNALKQTYPFDQATGFSVGEVRGAFTVTWPQARVSSD